MLFDKFQTMADFQAELAEREVVPFGAVTEQILSSTEGVVEGAGSSWPVPIITWACPDPRCIAAAQAAAAGGYRHYRVAPGQRLVRGTRGAGTAEIAQFYAVDHAIVFPPVTPPPWVCAPPGGPGRCHPAGRRQPRQHLRRRKTQRRRHHSLQTQRPGRPGQAHAPLATAPARP